MNRYLIVVDMQNDFIDGSLGTKEAQEIVENVVKEAKGFQGTVIFTQDTHERDYLDTQEGQRLPVSHCIKGTAGWELCPALEEVRDSLNSLVIEKPTFGSVHLAEYLSGIHMTRPIDEIRLVGLCTDICVISNALLLKAFLPEVKISVRKDCCAGVSPESHEAALVSMACCQIEIL